MAVRRIYSIVVLDNSKARQGENGYQFPVPKDCPSFFYFNQAEAIDVAMDIASRNPKVPVVLMESVNVFETKKPEIIQKVFKENGDLIPK